MFFNIGTKGEITSDPAYNEFSYKEHPTITNRFHCTTIIHGNAKISATMITQLQWCFHIERDRDRY